MTLIAPRYDRWKAPAADGELLVWPAVPALLEQTQDNQQRLDSADDIRLQNIKLPAVRRSLRQWLGHTDNSPIIGTGHQTELYHPGVWAKDVLIDVVARKLSGKAIHFAVDTDEPKHLQVRCPRGSIPLLDNPDTAARWTGLLPTPTPAHLAEIETKFTSASRNWDFKSLLPNFLASMKRAAMGEATLPAALVDSFHQLDWNLGLEHHALLTSPIWVSQPYLVFAHHILARLGQFAADYNAALADYRRENKIHSAGRPMPDLGIIGDQHEAPFWLDALSEQSRRRAMLGQSASGQFFLEAGNGDPFHFDPQADGWDAADRFARWLNQHQLRLSPRALTLTAVLRLLVVDQFVHGIGGGQYDQVLDGLIQRQFGFDPPRFSVTTATLFFPTAVGQTRVCLPCLAMEGRKLKSSILGERKMAMVRAIEAAPRKSTQRLELFLKMRDQLAQATTTAPIQAWEAHYAQAQRRSIEEKTLFDRELFYAIQPASRLSALIERYRELFK